MTGQTCSTRVRCRRFDGPTGPSTKPRAEGGLLNANVRPSRYHDHDRNRQTRHTARRPDFPRNSNDPAGSHASGRVCIAAAAPRWDDAVMIAAAVLTSWLRQGLQPRVNAISDVAEPGDGATRARLDTARRIAAGLGLARARTGVVLREALHQPGGRDAIHRTGHR